MNILLGQYEYRGDSAKSEAIQMAPAKKKRPLTTAQTTQTTPKRVDYTLQDKIDILNYVENNPLLSDGAVTAHFRANGYPNIKQPVANRIKRQREMLRKRAKTLETSASSDHVWLSIPKSRKHYPCSAFKQSRVASKLPAGIIRVKARSFPRLMPF